MLLEGKRHARAVSTRYHSRLYRWRCECRGGWGFRRLGAVFFSYPVGQESFYELESGIRTLPLLPLDQHQTGFLLSGNNHSDSLNMTTKIRLTGLKPLTTYNVTFQVKLATNARRGLCGNRRFTRRGCPCMGGGQRGR